MSEPALVTAWLPSIVWFTVIESVVGLSPVTLASHSCPSQA